MTETTCVSCGRCRSGRRWFWIAAELGTRSPHCDDPVCIYGGPHEYGWTDTEQDAVAAMRAAVVRLGGNPDPADWRGRPVRSVGVRTATEALKRINAAKRKSRPPSGARDAEAVGHLYAVQWPYDEPGPPYIVTFRIARKTAKRVCFIRRERGHDGPDLGYADRAALERDGEIWDRTGREVLYTEPPDLARWLGPKPADLRGLRHAMADAHPDRGGTAEGFMAARERYQRALRQAS